MYIILTFQRYLIIYLQAISFSLNVAHPEPDFVEFDFNIKYDRCDLKYFSISGNTTFTNNLYYLFMIISSIDFLIF